jgi:hypothetical protein
MKFNVLAVASAFAVVSTAAAQSPRFNVHAIISQSGDVVAATVNGTNSLGTLQADTDSGSIGRATTTVLSTEVSFRVDSSTSVISGLLGECQGTGKYAIDGLQPVVVDWNWSSVSGSGSWKVLSSTGATVASLSFTNGSYTSTGGSFGTSQVGSVFLNLAAGNYTFLSSFNNGGTATSVVNFTFAPAPGAIVLLGAAGLVGTRRRR